MKKAIALTPDMTLEDQFGWCSVEFREAIGRIAKLAGRTPLGVYMLWREYSKSCQDSDQSALLSEFVEWNADRLGVNRHALQAAAELR